MVISKKQTQVVDGVAIAEKIKDEIVKEVLALNKQKVQNVNVRPNLAIILVGENKESELYVQKKQEEARKVGIDTHLYRFCEGDCQEDILKTIEILNKDKEIDGILVQLPLLNKFNADEIIEAIDRKKDVDSFHPANQGKKIDKIISPVHGAVLEILKEVGYNIKDKKILIISNSEIFTRNLKKILNKEGGETNRVQPNSDDFEKKISEADLIISAVGKAGLFKSKQLKKGAGVIDVGISREGKKVKGDFEPGKIKDRLNFYTPVPGGVGPITVAILLRNTLELFKLKK